MDSKGIKQFHIPLSRKQVLDSLDADGKMSAAERGKFAVLSSMLDGIFHFRYQVSVEKCKKAYIPYNPDLSKNLVTEDPSTLADAEKEFLGQLETILDSAEFTEVTPREMAQAMEGEGLFPISLDVDLDQFEWYRIFYQGKNVGDEKIPHEFLPLLKKKVKFEFFERLIVILKYRDEAYFKKKKIKTTAKPGKIYLKFLKGIPCADMEMVFPGAKPRMKFFNKANIVVPVLTCIGTILWNYGLYPLFYWNQVPYSISEKITTFDVEPTSIVSGGILALLLLFGTYAGKVFSNYKQTIQDILSQITSTLYFKNLVSNQSVFTALIDMAEEEESKKSILGYHFLLNSGKPWAPGDLERAIERWLKERHDVLVDFDMADALGDTLDLGIVKRLPDGRIEAIPLDKALVALDVIWETAFKATEKERK
jgi:hypothetical protein